MFDNKYQIQYKGEVVHLNSRLIESRGINDATLEVLKESHKRRIDIFQEAERCADNNKLRDLAALFEELEFLQQAMWGFPQDRNFHRWFEFPGCTCPKMDNMDTFGTSHRIISADCPIHGDLNAR